MDKPHYIEDLTKEIHALREVFETHLEEDRVFREAVRPMIEKYQAATTLGKWVMGILAFVGTTVGVLLGVRELIK